MAKLPSTIYKEILRKQRELYKSGATDGSIALLTVYEIFFNAGYKQSTANKWLLNWAVCRCCCFEKSGNNFRVTLGDYTDKTPEECLNGIWLPVKEVWITNDEGKRARGFVV